MTTYTITYHLIDGSKRDGTLEAESFDDAQAKILAQMKDAAFVHDTARSQGTVRTLTLTPHVISIDIQDPGAMEKRKVRMS